MYKIKLLIILGEGGHSTELLYLVDLLGDNFNYCYIVANEDNISVKHIKIPGQIYRVKRPRGKRTNKIKAILNLTKVLFRALVILQRCKPSAILSTGPAIAVPVSIVGKLFGIRIIFIETGSRIENLSLTGRIMYHFADLFFIQWPQLKRKAARAIYAGRLI